MNTIDKLFYTIMFIIMVTIIFTYGFIHVICVELNEIIEPILDSYINWMEEYREEIDKETQQENESKWKIIKKI